MAANHNFRTVFNLEILNALLDFIFHKTPSQRIVQVPAKHIIEETKQNPSKSELDSVSRLPGSFFQQKNVLNIFLREQKAK
jgi:hypothetical protein